MRGFVARWGAWRILLILVFTVVAVVLVVFIGGTSDRIAITGSYVTSVLTLFTISVPPAPQETEQPTPSYLRWWSGLGSWTRRGIRTVLGALLLVGVVFLVVRIVQGPAVPVEFRPSITRAQDGVPIRLDAIGSAAGHSTLHLQINLSPLDKSGLCVTRAQIRLVPVLDDAERSAGAVLVSSGDVADLDVDGGSRSLAVLVTVLSRPGCAMNLSVGEAYLDE